MKLKDAIDQLGNAIRTHGPDSHVKEVVARSGSLLIQFENGTEAIFRVTSMHPSGVCKHCKKILSEKEQERDPVCCPRCSSNMGND